MASRTQVTLTFIKTFALVLIIIPGVIALAKGGRMKLLLLRIHVSFIDNAQSLSVSSLFQVKQRISRMASRSTL